jgi:lipopolysaccharide transport system ATP-binding protein
LEVGTGFHPELTGRENIYLNGAILGMSRFEIDRKFDEIVEFSGVKKFLDTPVKRYSSGMSVRLAFAVAAHLEPEILIVDEVLAVGDAEFQKKCLGKMHDVAGLGRTVLFVSHNMGAVQELCSRVILLDAGRILAAGCEPGKIIRRYLHAPNCVATEWVRKDREYDQLSIVPLRLYLGNENGDLIGHAINNEEAAFIYMEADIRTKASDIDFGYILYTDEQIVVYSSYHWHSTESEVQIGAGLIGLRSKLPGHVLNEGKYHIEMAASFRNRKWILKPGTDSPRISFEIRNESPMWIAGRDGVLAPIMPWQNTKCLLKSDTLRPAISQ